MDGNEVVDIIKFNLISSSGLVVCNRLVYELVKLEQVPQLVKKRSFEKH